MAFTFKTIPYEFQGRTFAEHCDAEAWAHLHEQGCGKTKVALDTAAWWYHENRMKRLLVVAPNGVHRNWALDEIPVHMPDSCDSQTFIWDSNRAHAKRYLQQAADHLRYTDGLAVCTMSYHGIMTRVGRRYAERFLEEDCGMYLDEAHHCKDPNTPRVKGITALGRRAIMRRIFTGTYCDEGPFDVFAPLRFLDENFWRRPFGARRFGFPTFTDYKAYFAKWSKGYGRGREFPVLDEYRNLEELREMIKLIGDRLTLDEVAPWLPKHRFTTRTFELPRAWRKAYDELEHFFETELPDGSTVTAELGITRALRLHQICCGYVATDDGRDGELVDLPGKNPRLEMFEALAEDATHQSIVWATWTRDIDKLTDMLGKRCVRFDGKVKPADRDRAKAAIKAGDVQFLVGNPAAGGEGHTILTPTMWYYSLGYKARLRKQSLARNRRPGAENIVGKNGALEVVDFMANDTKDVHVVNSLNKKQGVSDQITGDLLRI